MYERFTDRARKAMQLANQEAQRFNHEYIGTEHILLGLFKEGSGVAVNVLKNLDIRLRKVRQEVEKIVQYGPSQTIVASMPQTPRAKNVIEYSIEEARFLNHDYIGTEHILLGLLREEDGVAAQVLMNLGLKLEKVRTEIVAMLGVGKMEQKKLEDLPSETRAAIKQLEVQIDQHNQEKEAAVAAFDFEKAAFLRDQADKLKKRRQQVIREGQENLD